MNKKDKKKRVIISSIASLVVVIIVLAIVLFGNSSPQLTQQEAEKIVSDALLGGTLKTYAITDSKLVDKNWEITIKPQGSSEMENFIFASEMILTVNSKTKEIDCLETVQTGKICKSDFESTFSSINN